MAFNDVITLDRVLQIGIEGAATPGTTVAATKQMQTLMLMPSIKLGANPFRPSGGQYTTVAPPGKEFTQATVSGTPSFGELVYLFTNMFGAVTPTTPVTGVYSKQWQWNSYGNLVDQYRSWTVETGDAFRAERFAYGVLIALGLKFTRDKIDITGTMDGQKTTEGAVLTPLTGVSAIVTASTTGTVTAGTFALVIDGITVAGIAWNTTAAALQALINTAIGSGNCTVTGGPFPATPIILTFGGAYGNQPVSVVTSAVVLTGGSASVANTTPGVGITAEPQAQIVTPQSINFYADANSGNLGNTQMLNTFENDWSQTDKYQQKWPLNSSLPSFQSLIPKAPKAEQKLTMASDAQGRTFLDSLRAGSSLFTRVQAIGPIIEGTIPYTLTIDTANKIKDAGNTKDLGGEYVRDFTLDMAHDYAYGKAVSITLINTLQSL